MYDGSVISPIELLPEEQCAPEPPVIPLDVSILQPIVGYENVKYYKDTVPPLITPPLTGDFDERRPTIRQDDQFESVGYISEDEAQEALLREVAQSCCYGKSAAREMEIYRIIPSSALHYTLETFTENRSTSWDQEPYTGQRVDGPSNGAAPLPWDIHCNPTQMFHDEVRFLEVPHTATITCCYACGAAGWTKCHSCLTRGYKQCVVCCGAGRVCKIDPYGHRHMESCWYCHGTGRKRCSYCNGEGRIVCRICEGYRNLKCFIKLRIEYTNYISEHVIEHSDMPEDLLKSVEGEYILEQIQPRVWPITDYHEQELCMASENLLQQHLLKARNTRVLMQRQKLRLIAVSECIYGWGETEGRFWVYGKEMAVYAPDYPQKHCWGCNIL